MTKVKDNLLEADAVFGGGFDTLCITPLHRPAVRYSMRVPGITVSSSGRAGTFIQTPVGSFTCQQLQITGIVHLEGSTPTAAQLPRVTSRAPARLSQVELSQQP